MDLNKRSRFRYLVLGFQTAQVFGFFGEVVPERKNREKLISREPAQLPREADFPRARAASERFPRERARAKFIQQNFVLAYTPRAAVSSADSWAQLALKRALSITLNLIRLNRTHLIMSRSGPQPLCTLAPQAQARAGAASGDVLLC